MISLVLALALVSPTVHAGGCGETCSLDGNKGVLALSEADFVALRDTWAQEPLGPATGALETMLFHHQASAQWLEILGPGPLSPAQARFLETELARNEYSMEMRLVDDAGQIRGHVGLDASPFDHKAHLYFDDTGSLGALLTSGRAKRVGLAHIWSRW